MATEQDADRTAIQLLIWLNELRLYYLGYGRYSESECSNMVISLTNELDELEDAERLGRATDE